jgi:RNA polymerase sigma factor (sigma-70 family)
MTPRAPAAAVPLGGDEERLLIEAAKADPRRFADLYERNFDRVYAFVARRATDRGEAEDLTSEVFHHALAHLSRFEWRGIPFAAWLHQLARNAVADRWERAARERGEASPMVDNRRLIRSPRAPGRARPKGSPADQQCASARRRPERSRVRAAPAH